MPASKARFVTLCQQLLALGVVIAMLGPAAGVVSLDVVVRPGADGPQERSASGGKPLEMSLVASEPVEPEVTEVPLSAGRPADAGQGRAARGTAEFVSEPQRVDGLTTLGVTWDGAALEEDQISVMARTRSGGTWSEWAEVEYHDEHRPDPGTREGRRSRPGTEPLVVGDVDEVQTKVVTRGGAAPQELTMAVIAPGRGDSARQAPAIETGEPAADAPGALESSEGEIELSASSYTRKPRIYSRAQWGADESLRDRSSLRYFEVHAGFVHHTVNANSYTADQVPGILRSIYAYHTRSRGWSDIGYNFLIDRFGRVWEGRYGGVDRPVVGAHTSGYNDYAFAASAIGNFEEVRPTSAMVDAYGRLMAWKLALHGVDASSTSQRVGSRTFPAVNGHRDAGSTACPGRYLYAQLSTIRSIAASTQTGWSGRERVTDIVGWRPDLVMRRASDKALFVVPTGGMLGLRSPTRHGTGWSRNDLVLASPDLTGDGVADVLVRNAATGRAGVRPGKGQGSFGGVPSSTSLLRGVEQLTATGDLDGDRRNDLVGVVQGQLQLFRGNGAGGFTKVLLAPAWPYDLTAATGDLDGDGLNDLLGRDGTGRLVLHPGTGRAALGSPRTVSGASWGGYVEITGFGDFTDDGRPDILARNARGRAFVFPGNGRGGFQHWLGPYTASTSMTSIAAVDVMGTDDADIVGLVGDALGIARHNGLQNLQPVIRAGRTLTDANLVLNVGDWDRDGPSDVVSRNAAGELHLHRGLSTGRLAAPTRIGTGFRGVRMLAAAGDVTGDGYPDLMGQPSGGAMRIYPGRGTAGMARSYVAHSAISAERQLGLGRWNRDGAPDNAFVSAGRVSWYSGNGPGGLTGARTAMSGADLSQYDLVLSPGDVDRRGRPDLVVRQRGTSHLWLLPGTATGFGERRYLAQGYYGYDLAG